MLLICTCTARFRVFATEPEADILMVIFNKTIAGIGVLVCCVEVMRYVLDFDKQRASERLISRYVEHYRSPSTKLVTNASIAVSTTCRLT